MRKLEAFDKSDNITAFFSREFEFVERQIAILGRVKVCFKTGHLSSKANRLGWLTFVKD